MTEAEIILRAREAAIQPEWDDSRGRDLERQAFRAGKYDDDPCVQSAVRALRNIDKPMREVITSHPVMNWPDTSTWEAAMKSSTGDPT